MPKIFSQSKGLAGVPGVGISESSTSVKAGTGTAFHTASPLKGTIYGQSSSASGINATAIGYGNVAAQSSIIIGTDNFTAGGIGNTIAITSSATNVKTSAAHTIIIGANYVSANGYGGIYIGTGVNVTATIPGNTSNNMGVYIGKDIVHTGATYAGAVIIGYAGNGRDGNHVVLIGSDIVTATGIQQSIVIGYAASSIDAQSNTVVIGTGAKAFVDATYGIVGGGNVAIGQNTFSGAWRATAIGSYAQALAVSSTAIGYGAYAQQGHGIAIGRGGYNDKAASILFYTGSPSATPSNFYFGGVAGAWVNPAMPGTETVNATSHLNAGTVYSKLHGISGRDANVVPSLTNTRGGHIRLVGGASTGTAAGGNVELAITPAGGVSNNTENAEAVKLSISGTTGNTSITGDLAVSGAISGSNFTGDISLTTTGTSGAASLVAGVLNVPQYSGGGGIASFISECSRV